MAGQRIEIPPYSMWAVTPVYETGGEIVFGLMKDVIVPDSSDFIYAVTPPDVNRLDIVSHRFYDTPALWWVIARVNNIIDPLVGVTLNQKLRIPTKSRLASEGVLNV